MNHFSKQARCAARIFVRYIFEIHLIRFGKHSLTMFSKTTHVNTSIRHKNQHCSCFFLGYQVIENKICFTLRCPTSFIFAASVQKV